MRNIYIVVIALLLSLNSWAQAPQKMSYQAIIRNTSNALITSSPVGMKISILQGSSSGSVIYSETQTTNTNSNGLVSIEIGNGTVVTGTFAAINWANGPYFIKTETDPTGGTAYTISGTSELLSVPYALHAKTAESITGGITEADPVFVASPANGISTTDISNWNNKLSTEVDGSITNELQTLSISNDTVYLSNGGYAKLPAGFDGNYNNLSNKPTNVSTFTNDAGYLTSFTEVDGSITNELQTLSISNDTVYLSNGGYAKLPAGFDGNYNSLTNKPTNVSTFTNDAGYLTSFTEVDGSITNELQTLSISNDTIYLSNGGYTKLPAGFDGNYNSLTNKPTAVSSFSNDAGYLTSFTEVDGSITNELQTLRISNDTIYLSNGGFAKLPASNAWGLNGNSGTVAGTNFIGTTDNVPLNFRVNNQTAGKIDLSNINTYLGYKAALVNSTGAHNSSFGAYSFENNTGGSYNTIMGSYSYRYNSNGNFNTIIGSQAGENNINGSRNVFIGYAAGYSETGSNKLYIANDYPNPPLIYGDFATAKIGLGTITPTFKLEVTEDASFNGVRVGRGNGNISNNTSVGFRTLNSNTTGANNTAVGFKALELNTTGGQNTAMGDNALAHNTSATGNTSIGYATLAENTTGNFNSALGYDALLYNTTGELNTALGAWAMHFNTIGKWNTALGFSSLQKNISGNNNTSIGKEAGFNNTAGSNNVFIGYQAGYSETGSNKLYIANSSTTTPLIYGDFTSGNVGIGTTSIGERLVVQGNHTDGRIATFQNTYDEKYITMGQVVTDDGGYIKYKKTSNYTGIGVHGHTEQLVVKGTGAVGIGTTNPLYSLDIFGVAGSPTAATLRVKGGNGSNGRILLADQDLTHGVTDWIATDVFGNITANSSFGGLALQGYSGSNSESGVEISAIIGSADPDDSKAAVQISSHKKNGTTAQSLGATETLFGIRNGFSATNNFVVLGNGNVGIGNTSPTAKLQVETYGFSNKTIWGINSMLIQNQTPGSRTLLALTPNGTQNADLLIFHNSDYTTNFECLSFGYENTANYFNIATNKGGTATQRGLILDATSVASNLRKQFVLNPDGNIGIGTSTPTAKLEVNGAIKVTGGTASQFLKADGSLDNNTYLTAIIEVADEFSATAAQTSFTLTQTPSTNSKVKMYINGVRISNTAYSVSGTTLTYVPANNGSYVLSASDRIQFDYSY